MLSRSQITDDTIKKTQNLKYLVSFFTLSPFYWQKHFVLIR